MFGLEHRLKYYNIQIKLFLVSIHLLDRSIQRFYYPLLENIIARK
jgi:Na+/phosphate symporter